MQDQTGSQTTGGEAFLSPYRVLDLTDEQGLLAGHLFAQLGSDVIQVERPGGSHARQSAPFDPAAPEDHRSLFWSAYAAGKRGVVIAYDQPEGREALLQLVRKSDVLIESAGPGRMAALGLGYEELKAVNPQLVYVTITPFGQDGPKAEYAPSDLVMWASAGPLAPHRASDGTPLRICAPQAYHQAAMDAACGAMMALYVRPQLGHGQHVDVSIQQSVTLCTLFAHLAAAVGHQGYSTSKLTSSKQLDLSGSGSRSRNTKWPVKDGVIEMHIGIGPAAGSFANSLFAWLKELGECPEEFADWNWITLPQRFDAGELTMEDMERAREHAGGILARYTVNEMMQIAQEKGLMLAPQTTVADLPTNIHFQARGLFSPVEEAGRKRSLPMPYKTGSGGPTSLRPAPGIGEHNTEVFAELGVQAPAAKTLAGQGAA